MTEQEKLKHAENYITKLANGIDPLHDTPVSDTDCINQVKVSRCLFFVSDVLQKLIENNGTLEKPSLTKKAPFSLTPERLERYCVSETPIPVSEITRRLNTLINPDTTMKLKYTSILAFLVQTGFLTETKKEDGSTVRIPTRYGTSIGISTDLRIRQTGTYPVIVYNEEAQRLILDNMDAIMEINNRKSGKWKNHGLPWSKEDEDALRDLFLKGTPVSQLSAVFDRSGGGIRDRLKKLGLIE